MKRLPALALALFTFSLGLTFTLLAANPAATTTTTSSQPATITTGPKDQTGLPTHVYRYEKFTYTNPQGKTLHYRLFIPEKARISNESNKFPLVLFLHGSGGAGDNNNRQLIDGGNTVAKTLLDEKIQAKFPCFVLAPQCPKKQTWGGLDFVDKKITAVEKSSEPLDLTLELLTTLTQNYPIDTDRLYITGLSLGGFGTWQAIAQSPDTFAAAVPICGGAADATLQKAIKSQIPIWNFHGDKDNAVNVEFSRTAAKAFKDANAPLKYTEYPGVPHDSWNKAYADPELLPWLFAQKKSARK